MIHFPILFNGLNFIITTIIIRQGLIWPRLVSNSLCSWPWTSNPTGSHLLSAEMTAVRRACFIQYWWLSPVRQACWQGLAHAPNLLKGMNFSLLCFVTECVSSVSGRGRSFRQCRERSSHGREPGTIFFFFLTSHTLRDALNSYREALHLNPDSGAILRLLDHPNHCLFVNICNSCGLKWSAINPLNDYALWDNHNRHSCLLTSTQEI